MTKISTVHHQIVEAVERGNVAQAVRLGTQIVGEDQPIPELIEELEAALTAGNKAEARTIRRQIARRLDEKQSADEQMVKRAKAAIISGNVDDASRQELTQAIQLTADTTRLRSGFLTLAGMYLGRVDDIEDIGALGETSDSLRNREQELDDVQEQVATVVEDTRVPAHLAFVGGAKRPTIDVDTPDPLEIRIRNVGQEPARSVELTASPPKDIDASLESTSPGSLDPRESATVKLLLDSLEPGDHQLTVVARAPEANEATRTVVVTAEDLGSEDPLIRAFTGPENTVRFQDVIRAIAHYNDGTTVPGSETKRLDFEEVLWLIEEYNADT